MSTSVADIPSHAPKIKPSLKVFHISFPKSEKDFVKSLGGFLRLSKPQGDKLCGRLQFARPEDAESAMATEAPAGVTITRAAAALHNTDSLSLKVIGIPNGAGIADVSALFPESSTIMLKERRRNNFYIGSDKQSRHLFGMEAVVRFESREARAKAVREAAGAQIMGQKVTITPGQKNHKVNKSLRKNRRQTKRNV